MSLSVVDMLLLGGRVVDVNSVRLLSNVVESVVATVVVVVDMLLIKVVVVTRVVVVPRVSETRKKRKVSLNEE